MATDLGIPEPSVPASWGDPERCLVLWARAYAQTHPEDEHRNYTDEECRSLAPSAMCLGVDPSDVPSLVRFGMASGHVLARGEQPVEFLAGLVADVAYRILDALFMGRKLTVIDDASTSVVRHAVHEDMRELVAGILPETQSYFDMTPEDASILWAGRFDQLFGRRGLRRLLLLAEVLTEARVDKLGLK